jgi:hypothetical protein
MRQSMWQNAVRCESEEECTLGGKDRYSACIRRIKKFSSYDFSFVSGCKADGTRRWITKELESNVSKRGRFKGREMNTEHAQSGTHSDKLQATGRG